jgi:DNA-binding MarR family transcriptional regulator
MPVDTPGCGCRGVVKRLAGKRTARGTALTDLVLELFRVNGRLLAAGDALTAPFEQSSARWQVLGALMDGAKTVSAAARRICLARRSVQRLADRLVDDGLCACVCNPAHRRAPLLSYTRRGEEILHAINTAQSLWANEIAMALKATELEAAVEVLRRLRRRLEERDGP